MSNRPLINLDEVPLESHAHGMRFEASTGAIAPLIGARKLGYRLVVVPAGKCAWPYHLHHVNEEMFFILDGSGTLRLGDARYPVRAGDVIAAPPGMGRAHQLINTSDRELRYLAVSTMEAPDVFEYPDSGKFGVFAGAAPGAETGRTFSYFGRQDSELDYWAGEDERADESG
jgi:uncharacterized cupin superfamily protein